MKTVNQITVLYFIKAVFFTKKKLTNTMIFHWSFYEISRKNWIFVFFFSKSKYELENAIQFHKKLNIYVFVYKYETVIWFTVFIGVNYEVTVIGFTVFIEVNYEVTVIGFTDFTKLS